MYLNTRKFYRSRDVIFHENIFPFSITYHQSLFPSNATTQVDCPSVSLDMSVSPTCSHSPFHSVPSMDANSRTPLANLQQQQARRSNRMQKTPGYLDDYVCTSDTESTCFSTLTSLRFQSPSIPFHCLNTYSQ